MNLAGIFFYIKDVNSKEVWKANYEKDKSEKYEVVFAEDVSKFTKLKNGIETEVKVIAASSLGTEIRSIKIKNNLESAANLDVIASFKPVLSRIEDDIAHPAFNNLFLKYEMTNSGDIIIRRNSREHGKNVFYLGTNLYTDKSSNLEYEIDAGKEKIAIENGIFRK